MPGNVRAVLSKNSIQFTPDTSYNVSDIEENGENSFDVTVINESDKFASFHVELIAPGVDEAAELNWYKISPEISTKKPPSSKTTFHVAITKAPIPAYDTTVDLILKVFSIEYEKLYTSQKISLTINKPLRSLRVELPVKELKILPGDSVEIPVIVYNLSPKLADVNLNFSGIDPDWLNAGNQKQLRIEPGNSEKISFTCQPPKNLQVPSKTYKFTVEARSKTSQYTTREQGYLEVLPDGVLEFTCTNKQQIIPVKAKKNSHKAVYELVFKNASNLPHCCSLKLPSSSDNLISLQQSEPLNLAPGETKITHLVAQAKRPWFGTDKRHFFEISPNLTNPNSGEPQTEVFASPSTQVLELKVLPIIPPLLQIGGGLLLTLLLLFNWLFHPKTYHTGAVNSIRLIGKAGQVVSGSSDQTIRLWQVDRGRWRFDTNRLEYEGKIASETENKKAVRVLRPSPMDDGVIAAGLDSGDIQVWDSLKREQILVHESTDRVFDLGFTSNARYLFSGHGSGRIRRWDLQQPSQTPSKTVNIKFAIYALAVTNDQPESSLVFAAGRYNKVAIWDTSKNTIYEIPYNYIKDKSNNVPEFQPIIRQQNYITSLAWARNTLAISDNQGYVTLWDTEKIRQCIANESVNQDIEVKANQNSQFSTTNKKPIAKKQSINNSIKQLTCDDYIIAQSAHEQSLKPVRSVALTQNACILASAGDDGNLKLWRLKIGTRTNKLLNPETIVTHSAGTKLNSVDIKALKDENNDYLLVASGDNKYNVKLHRVNDIKDNAGCE